MCIRDRNTGVEILPPDFGAKPELVGQVFDARPEVFAHNLETVPRIFKRIRPAFTYDTSLRVLSMAREAGLVTKSNLILGMGEEAQESEAAIVDQMCIRDSSRAAPKSLSSGFPSAVNRTCPGERSP